MASACLDDFVLNFDLNHLTNEVNIQSVEQKYDKLRKTTSWLKSKIISTDFAIQKYQSKKDDYEQAVKAHSITREELKQACINYKNVIDRCAILENENKILTTNQEVLKERMIDSENKYSAILSHSNQLQVLVKELEIENNATKVEKELDKCNNKERNEAIMLLQKEKELILNDIIALKDVILGKRKTNKSHVKLLKKYVKDIKWKASNAHRSEESDDDMETNDHFPSHNTKNLKKITNLVDTEFVSSAEQNFIDNCSDSSNGQRSVDTGRGSSRANSHDKYQGSPDYIFTPEPLPFKNVKKQRDVANSPIVMYPPRSVATSPIIFDPAPNFFENQYDEYTDCFDGPENDNFDDTSVSDGLDLKEQVKIINICISPVPNLPKLIDTGTSPIINNEQIIFKKLAGKSPKRSLFIESDETNIPNEVSQILGKESQRCFCQTVNDKKKIADASTSPLPKLPNIRKFIDIGTCTVNDGYCGNFNDSFKLKNQTPGFCEKATWTEIITPPNKKFINVCTSPIPELSAGCKCGDVATTITLKDDEEGGSRNCKKFTLNDTQNKKKLFDPTVSVISKEQNAKSVRKLLFTDKGESNQSTDRVKKRKSLPAKSSSMTVDNTISHDTERLRVQERSCLESNSSQNLHFESSTDSEVQHILNVMKLHHNVISPISKTRSNSQYLRLLPEMNFTLNKIWATLANISKSNGVNLNLSHPTEPNEVEVPEVEITFNEDIVKEVVGRTKDTNQIADCIYENNISFGSTHDVEEDSNETKSYVSSNTESSPNNKTNDDFLIPEADITHSQQESNTDTINNISPNVTTTTKTINVEISNITEVNNEGKGSHKTRSKSKLEKLRKKLLPTCKIKKMDSPVRSTLVHSFKRKDSNSSALNQKLAFEKAVKVMSELRSNQKLQKQVKILSSVHEEIKLGSTSGEIESTNKEFIEKTCNTKKICNGEEKSMEISKSADDCKVSELLEKIGKDNKLPTNRRLRKRPADTEVDNLLSKRVLRSSNVVQVPHQNSSHVSPSIKTEKPSHLFNNPRGKKNERNKHGKSLGSPLNSPQSGKNELEHHNETNINGNNNLKTTQYDNVELDKSYPSLEKDIRMMKPVIELSMCLTDNVNTVSITPGNIDLVNVNPNKLLKMSTAGLDNEILDSHDNNNVNSIMLQNDSDTGNNSIMDLVPVNTDIHNNNVDMKVTSNSQNLVKKMIETENGGSANSKNGSITEGIVMNNEFTESSNNSNPENITELLNRNSSGINNNNKEIDILHDNLTCTKQIESESLDVKVIEQGKETIKNPVVEMIPVKADVISNNIVNYSDLDLYEIETDLEKENKKKEIIPSVDSQRQSILCAALDRYGVTTVKYTAKKVPDTITNSISQKIEESIANIIGSSKEEQRPKMDNLVSYIQNYKPKYILTGLMKYLKDPTRKNELFNTIINGAAPPMTRPEMILLYVIEKLNAVLSDFVNRVWNNIEHALLQLNRAPEFNIIESMSHFYAVLCRYFRNKSRLRCFMLDAMYCLQFKAVPLIRQCLEVCPGVLPYAHEHLAKTSLVTCLVYLLHFYKCQDKFNRAQDIRNILYRKYSYRFSEWNETMILEIFRKAIMDLRGTQNDKKMLRVALIILCKRHGPKWCHLNIIQNMLMPIIDKKDIPERTKHFCILMLGPLLKPFPADRKAQCEIVVNNLLQMLKQENSQEMNEAIYSSLIFLNKHNQESVVQALLHWNPQNVSPDFKEILNDYVMEKPLVVWKKLVSRKPSQCS